ncbi:restriction endonuclease subunit S [Anoxybacillus geothermalis]|uniref:restriction endonuclease subunit S n=1 Tax=Geobacillus sp. DSP4a TaxID=2508873 RepID=UPI00067D772F|nr:Type-1 restriction enzyme EcoKI specificity protein [Geobacillus stearothermophilus]MED4923798.1 restriction endonuclease subunit S [Anoxybacillus geothermalis]NNV00129.1 restriction endonuclease subunit S [Geobacillus sp. DSP4a]
MEALLQHFHEAVTTEQDVEELKKLILKLAVRGKLVEQDPNDEPASELLKKIEKEKERLIAEKKIKKSKVPQAIANDEIPYELPKGWVWVKCVEIFYTLSTKNSLKSKDYLEEGKYPIIDQGKKFIAGYTNNEEAVIKIEYPITVFGDHTKEVKFVDFDFVPGADGTKLLCPFAPIYPKYFYWVIRSYELDDRGYGRHFKLLKEQLFPLPPVNEQIRIVEKIEALYQKCDELLEEIVKKQTASEVLNKSVFTRIQDYNNSLQMEDLQFAIENMEYLCNTKEDIDLLRHSILILAVQGKLVRQNPDDEPASVLLQRIKEEKERLIAEKKIKKEKPLPPITSDEIPYALPNGWEWERIGNLSKVVEYGTSHKATEVNVGVPVLRMNNIKGGKVVYDDLKYVEKSIEDLPRLYLKKGDILFNRTNSYELVGKSGCYLGNDDEYTFASYLIRVSLFKEYLIPEYVNYFINSPVCRTTQIEPHITQQNGQANFNGTKLKRILIPIPPKEEQKRIVTRLNNFMELCDELEKRISKKIEANSILMSSIIQRVL